MNDLSSPITAASHQWATRPFDQRFVSLPEMAAFAHGVKDQARGQVVSSRRLECLPAGDDHKGLQLVVDGTSTAPTNWAFGQLAARASAPAGYLRNLPSELAADCINWGLYKSDVADVGVLVHNAGSAQPMLAAATGPNYGRVWNTTIIDALIERFGDGVTGAFRVPGEFGQAVQVNRSNTTLYASDRDMFVFLADEENRIEVPGRRSLATGAVQDGSLARGFFVWNSEVGSQTFGVASFLFDYVCMNRMIWGPAEYREFKIRHTSKAPDKWVEEVAPALLRYRDSDTATITAAIEGARAARLDDVDTFLAGRKFRPTLITAIKAAHMEEEGRPIETLWDAQVAITAVAREIPFQDERVALEREGGKVFALAA